MALSLQVPLLGDQIATVPELARRGSVALQDGRPAEALQWFRKAIEGRPDDPALAFNLGLALFRLGRLEDALEPLGRAVAHSPSAANARFLRGIAYFQRADYGQAALELEKVRGHGRFGEQALYMLTESYRLTGRVAAAETSFLELERRFPDSALYRKLLGTAYEAEGSYAKALQEFRAAIRIDAGLPEVNFAIGFVHFKRWEHDQAAIWFKRELEVQPCHAKAYYYLAEISVSGGDLPAAEERYRQALACDESYASALAGLGAVHTRQQRYDEALQVLRRAVEIAPEHAEAHYGLAQALLRLGRREDAEAALAKVRAIHAVQHQTAREALGSTASER